MNHTPIRYSLTVGKCNLWKLSVSEATVQAHWQSYCPIPRIKGNWNALVESYLAINPQYH